MPIPFVLEVLEGGAMMSVDWEGVSEEDGEVGALLLLNRDVVIDFRVESVVVAGEESIAAVPVSVPVWVEFWYGPVSMPVP